MKATEAWLYLCAVHKKEAQDVNINPSIKCCAMDYMIHNLDQSASYLTNTKNYPSRVSIP